MGTELDLEKNKSSQKEFQTLLNKDFENRKLKENSMYRCVDIRFGSIEYREKREAGKRVVESEKSRNRDFFIFF